MYAVIGLGAVVATAAVLAARSIDEKTGRNDMYYHARSAVLADKMTKMVDELRSINDHDNVITFLRQLGGSAASALESERADLFQAGSGPSLLSGMQRLLKRMEALVDQVSALEADYMRERDIAKVVGDCRSRIGDSFEGVCGKNGTRAWLRGGVKRRLEEQADEDEQARQAVAGAILEHARAPNTYERAWKAKSVMLNDLLDRTQTKAFERAEPVSRVLVLLDNVDLGEVEYAASKENFDMEGLRQKGGDGSLASVSVGDIFTDLVNIAKTN